MNPVKKLTKGFIPHPSHSIVKLRRNSFPKLEKTVLLGSQVGENTSGLVGKIDDLGRAENGGILLPALAALVKLPGANVRLLGIAEDSFGPPNSLHCPLLPRSLQ